MEHSIATLNEPRGRSALSRIAATRIGLFLAVRPKRPKPLVTALTDMTHASVSERAMAVTASAVMLKCL